MPRRPITAPTFTDKDRDDLAFGLRYRVDYVALSFVRTAADVLEARGTIQDHGRTIPLIAKIETAHALTHIDEIIDSVDGVMVARGDLGVAIPLATVPRLQKMLRSHAARRDLSRLALAWGVVPLLDQSQPTTDELIDGALGAALAAARVRRGDTVVITAGVPVGRPGMTNLIKGETL